MKCDKCGANISKNAKTCDECGGTMKAARPAAKRTAAKKKKTLRAAARKTGAQRSGRNGLRNAARA